MNCPRCRTHYAPEDCHWRGVIVDTVMTCCDSVVRWPRWSDRPVFVRQARWAVPGERGWFERARRWWEGVSYRIRCRALQVLLVGRS